MKTIPTSASAHIRSEGDHIAGDQGIRGHGQPGAASVHVDTHRGPTHVVQHGEAGLALAAHHALEEHQHQQREHTVIPVVVKTPQEQAQHLENEKRSHQMVLSMQ